MNNYFKKISKNRFLKRSINIMLSGVLAVNMLGMNGYAVFSGINKNSNRVSVGRVSTYLAHIMTDKKLIFATYVKQADNGKYALCMQHIKPAPNGLMYTKGDKINDLGMKHIALSEPNMGSFEEDYYVRQVALNYYQGDINYITGALNRGDNYRDRALEIAAEAEQVAAGTMVSPYFEVNSINISSSHNNEFTLNGDYYVTDWFNVSHTGNLKNYSVNLNNAPSNVQILDANENVVTNLSSANSKFKLRVHKQNVTKDFNNIDISLTGNFTELHPTKYIPDDTKYQILLLMDEYTVQARSGTSVTGSIDPRGGIKLIKTDENGTKLANAEFDLKKNGAVVDTGTTNAAGELLFSDLELGTYELVEKNAPAGFVLDVTPTQTIVTAGTIKNVTVENEIIKGRIAVTKRDKEINNLMLEGVEFEIYDAQGRTVDKIVTDKNGYGISKLLNYGTYTMKEVKSDEGYHLNNTVYTINITEHQKTYSYDIENQIYKGRIHIVKVDSQNEETPVPGAGFDIIAEDVKGISKGTVVEHVVTDANGFAITGDLRYGTYKVKEVVTPQGFWQSNKEYTMNIIEDGKTYVRYIKNDPIEVKIRVIKTDGKDKMLLPGVTFKIVNKDTGKDVVFKEYVGGEVRDKVEFITDEHGEFITPQILRAGEYQLVETKPAEGYKVLAPIDFSVNENSPMEDIEAVGQVIKIGVSNDRITGNMKLTKVDTYTKEPLSDVEFSIECIDGFMKGQTFKEITDENGLIKLDDLEYGKYKVTEVKTKEDYVLNIEPQYFNIEKDGETIELTFENKPKEGYIEVIKVDADSKRPIEDVEFTIYNEADEEVEKLITDKDGKAKSNKLKYGKYKIAETKAAENYLISESAIDFEIIEDEQVITQNIENIIMKGDLDFAKIDTSTKAGLDGAVIQITGKDEHNDYIDMEFTSSKDGDIFRLPIGEYKLKEVSAPKGYIKTSKTVKFTITTDETTVVKLENKQDKPAGTSKPLTGDDIFTYSISSLLAIIGLVIVNNDKLKKLVYASNPNRFKRPGYGLDDEEEDDDK